MSRSRIGRRVLLGFAALMAVAFAGAAVLLWSIVELSRPVESIAQREFPASRALAGIDGSVHQAMRGMNGMLADRILADAEARDAVFRMTDEALAEVGEARRRVDAISLHPEDRAAWSAIAAGLDRWSDAVKAFVETAHERERLARAGTAVSEVDERAWSRYRDARAAYVAVSRPLEELQRAIDGDVEALRVAATEAARRGILLGVVAIVLATLANCAIVLRLVRGVDRSLGKAQDEAKRLRDAVAKGQLAVRADPSAVEPDFRPLVASMNETVEAFRVPFQTAASYVERISHGEIPPPITDRYEGEFNALKDALNRCIGSLEAVIADMERMSREQLEGDYEAYVDAKRHQGSYRKLADGVNAGVRHHVDAILEFLGTIQTYAAGDFSRTLRRFPGKQAVAHQIVDGIRDNLKRVAAEVTALTGATVEGKLSARADASKFQGDWAALVRGVNETLDAVTGPLSVAARYVERISAGDLPEPISAEYRGDLAAVKQSVNQCIEAVGRLVRDVDGLAAAAISGQLGTRAAADRHQGGFRKVVEGVNRTLDAVLAPVDEATRALERLAGRDLRARVSGTYRGDHARIQEAVNGTASSLAGALGQVADAAQQVRSAASQIASSSQAVASGASEQAASLEETGAVLDTVSGSSRQAADSAHQANLLAQSARTAAQDGAAAVEQLQAAMGQIKASAEGTSQIIKDVSEIAFQTNLLALNAAVEAARAGEAGRGFAVVAEEVRSLALRAKDAAQKTEALIRASVKQAQEGESTASRVAGKLTEIHGAVGKVTDIVAEISATAKEQAHGVVEVSRAVSEMDKVTQQNAASAEESSSTASELSSQADELASLVETFQLDREASPRTAKARPALAVPPAPARPAARPVARPVAKPAVRTTAAPAAPPAPKPNGKANGKTAQDPFPMDDDVLLKDF